MMTNYASRQIILSVLGLALIIIAVFGVSYAIQVISFDKDNNNNISSPSLIVKYQNGKSKLNINNKTQFDDKNCTLINNKDNNMYFSISFDSSISTSINYELSIEKFNVDNQMDDNDVRFYLEKKVNGKYVSASINDYSTSFFETFNDLNPNKSMILNTGNLGSGSTDYYRLVGWNYSNVDSSIKNYEVKVNVFGKIN